MISNNVTNWLNNQKKDTVKVYHPYRIDDVAIMFSGDNGIIAFPDNNNILNYKDILFIEDHYEISDLPNTVDDQELAKEFTDYLAENTLPVFNTATNELAYRSLPWKTLPDKLNNLWEQLSDEQKELLRIEYKKECTAYQIALEKYFGKDNLVPPPPINNWNDLITIHPEFTKKLKAFDNAVEDLVYRDSEYMISQYKIINIINCGYGGIITNKEWQNENIVKYRIVINAMSGGVIISSTIHNTGELLTFRSREQAETFRKYNEDLINQFLKR